MNKQITLFIITLMLVMMLTACSSAQSSEEQVAANPTPEISVQDAPPGKTFSTAEEAIKKIKEVKAAGAEKMTHLDDFKLYDKDSLYLLKECPIPGFKQDYIVLIPDGLGTFYTTDASREEAIFRLHQGWRKDESLSVLADSYDLKQYMDTKYYFGEYMGDIHIFWWENGFEFNFEYPSDTDIAPEDVIKNIEVEKIDL